MTEPPDEPEPSQAPFAITPVAILAASDANGSLTGADLRTYIALRSYANRAGDCYPKLKTVAERGGVSLPAVKRSVARLAALKLVEITHQYRDDGSLRASLYHFPDVSPQETQPDEKRDADRDLFVAVMGEWVCSDGSVYNAGRISAAAWYEEFRTRHVRKKGTRFTWPGRFVDSLDERRLEEWMQQEGLEPA